MKKPPWMAVFSYLSVVVVLGTVEFLYHMWGGLLGCVAIILIIVRHYLDSNLIPHTAIAK